ncbi:MAG TPA: deaminase [Candidatus Azoamicus sp. OHIO2]
MNWHIFWMNRAVLIARKASSLGNIPIGAILVRNNFEIGVGLNFKQFNYYSIAHAEITALKQSSFYCRNRLAQECAIYTTLEPCFTCLSVLLLFNIKYIVFGAYYNKKLLYTTRKTYKNKIIIIGGILENQCSVLLNNFYIKQKR